MNKLRSMVTILLERARNIMKQSTNKKKDRRGNFKLEIWYMLIFDL
jgi:hypothetical protein